MLRPVKVEPRPDYRLYLEYSDGTAGEVDLSHLAGRGVFKAWGDSEFYRAVRLEASRHVSLGDGIELCADSLYMKLTDKTPEDIFPGLASRSLSAGSAHLGGEKP